MARILVVEDDPDSAMLMERVLQKLGRHQARATEDVEQVLKLCRAGEVDLVLMDVSLQNSVYRGKPIDGLQITRLLKEDERTRHLPVLLVTAHAMRGDRERFLGGSGADGYVVKPIADLDAFLETVNQVLSGRRGPAPALSEPDRSPSVPPMGEILHDLGKLLFSIRAALGLLLEQAEFLRPASRELVAIALRSTDRLIRLLKGVVWQNGASPGPADGERRQGPERGDFATPFETAGLLQILERVAPGSRRILVVDDDPDVVRVLTGILEVRGYEVIPAFDGPEALEQARKAKPDVMILDLDMPGMDGYEVLFHLKRTEALRRIPVIIFTGTQWGEEATARGLGAEGYVSKSFLPEVKRGER